MIGRKRGDVDMALSNWDACGWDGDGNPLIPVAMEFPDGVKVEIYKNWVYIYDQKAWTRKTPYAKPIVMEFWHGDLHYKRLHLIGKRGRQRSIYLYAEYNDYKKGIKLKMFGIGAYGFRGDEYVGIEVKTVEDFIEWLKEQDIDYVEPKKILRYNQGDYYFHTALGLNIQVTEPEKTKTPYLNIMLGIKSDADG